MKDAINFLIPIVQDPLNDITTGRCVSHHVSMNGYYGYQPVAVGKEEDFRRPPQQNQTNNSLERMETNCDMDIQFNNCMEPEEDDSNAKREPAKQEPFKSSTRKRTLIDVDNCSSCKKRRQNDPVLPHPQQEQQTTYNCDHVRKPTHNIPDISRCMMGHYI
ncbi:PREDICTED: uncharacterized protein LOC108560271 isoform X1 [Nicrophorus vespilloides]|uniref:Uncharacterized protein LOC108560271 isoform X1 n=1 Tax=Nicrophorus vespilloides TaxID=110193 RepID=A0ABM1MF82_NICVS|nr:PREDICTED: uncharacterized protein LOC108560271 isoform X1 [Nicrophorus vespilloides]